MNEFDEGIEIFHIDKDQKEMIINLEKIRMFHNEYCELKQRIGKAIEYINNNWDGSSYTDAILKSKVAELNITELLEILRGGSNE